MVPKTSQLYGLDCIVTPKIMEYVVGPFSFIIFRKIAPQLYSIIWGATINHQNSYPSPKSPQGSLRVPPDFAWAALTVTETLCGACAPHLDYWNPKAKAVGE